MLGSRGMLLKEFFISDYNHRSRFSNTCMGGVRTEASRKYDTTFN